MDEMTIMAKIPKLKTEKEIRDFWDTHDSADYIEDMEEDRVIVAESLRKNIRVKLKPASYKKLRIIAKHQRISSSKLLQNCIEKSLQSLDVKRKHA